MLSQCSNHAVGREEACSFPAHLAHICPSWAGLHSLPWKSDYFIAISPLLICVTLGTRIHLSLPRFSPSVKWGLATEASTVGGSFLRIKVRLDGTSLVVQWLRLRFHCRRRGFDSLVGEIPGQGDSAYRAVSPKIKKKKKKV